MAASAVEPACEAAVAIANGGGEDALRIAAELLAAQPGWNADRVAQCLRPAEEPTGYDGADLGALWKEFTETLDALVPILVFVGLFTLALLVLARLLALLPKVRNMRSKRSWRITAWIAGLALAVLVPVYVALRGMWVMAQGGPKSDADVDAKGYGFERFVPDVLWRSGTWWVVLLVALVTLAILAFAFATRQGVAIKLKSKDDGTGLDSAHIMAAMDAMAGQTNRGLEFPVGTDLTTAAAAVSELSDNKFVATLQVAVSAIVGATPWTLTVENEGEKAASVTISRNGALMKAKRVKIGETLSDVSEMTAAELLAALISGELIASLRSRYRSEFDADLSGATDGESIALHYIASSALSTNRAARAKGIPILARAAELDPQNRAAWTTLANYAYRDPKIHDPKNPLPHIAYREFLDGAILEELTRARNGGIDAWVWRRTQFPLKASQEVQTDESAFAGAQQHVRISQMRKNGLLLRLLQTRVVAAMNANAAAKLSGMARDPSQEEADAEYMKLRRETFGGPLSKREPPKLAVRRRQLLLIDEFRASRLADEPTALPEALRLSEFAEELAAWKAALPHRHGDASAPTAASEHDLDAPDPGFADADRFVCEEAALSVSGDFARDPTVAYSLACYRAVLFASSQGSPS
ncbi:hypothetical protein ACWKWN_15085 [Microbacterium trichothecenolyticum]